MSITVPFADVWYFDSIVDGVRRTMLDAGHDAVIHLQPFGRDAPAMIADRLDVELLDAECIGVVCVGFGLTEAQGERLRAHGRPVVSVGGLSPGSSSVRIDDVDAARVATDHLLRLGHRLITHLAGYATVPDNFSMRSDRIRGYSESMAAAGVERLSQVRPCEFDADSAYRVTRELLTGPEAPTALFAVTDELAAAAIRAARDLGLRVPEDLSVIGIDDSPGAAELGLTTVRQDTGALGAAAAGLVLRPDPDHPDRMLPTELVERASTMAPGSAPPPAKKSWRGNLFGRSH